MKSSATLGILGGGISGLSLGYLFEGSSEVVEKEEFIGGHCRSHTRDGFRYDEGGHILFSRNHDVLDRMVKVLGDNVGRHYRNNKIWYRDRFVKYPFENALGELDKEDTFECLYHYVCNKAFEPANFKEWILTTFGRGIAERYLIPYNEKLWKMDLSEISLDWVGERVPRPPVEDVIRSAVGISTEGYTHQLYFYYPKTGGFESLVTALVECAQGRLLVTTGFEVRRVWRERGRWLVSDGHRERSYDKIVCTMPVDSFLSALEGVPSDVTEGVRGLRCNPTIVVLVGLADCSVKDIVAAYFPQPALVFHRVCFYHSYAEDCVPPGRYAAVAEISTRGESGLWTASDDEIAGRVIHDMAAIGLFRERDVITTDVSRIKYSYVVYDHNYRRNINIVRNYVKGLGVDLLGRFAEWEYLNTDQCFERAMRLVDAWRIRGKQSLR